jgi:toxin ParE1/3/4
MRIVRILAAAADEAVEAAAWYESERYGLGVEFERAIDAALDLLEEDIVPLTPAVGAAARKLGAKRLTLRRFPYDIVVRESGDEIIVIAFAHHARRPGYWRKRAPRS